MVNSFSFGASAQGLQHFRSLVHVCDVKCFLEEVTNSFGFVTMWDLMKILFIQAQGYAGPSRSFHMKI